MKFLDIIKREFDKKIKAEVCKMEAEMLGVDVSKFSDDELSKLSGNELVHMKTIDLTELTK